MRALILQSRALSALVLGKLELELAEVDCPICFQACDLVGRGSKAPRDSKASAGLQVLT